MRAARGGQVALYLLMVLVAIAVLMFANVNMFLAVRSKNRMMNAVDAAAIAAARHQGKLLNEVGRLNVEHLKAAVRGEAWVDEEGNDRMRELRELVFIRPLEGIRLANDAARDWGFSDGVDGETLANFRDHLSEIRNNPEFYPRSGENDPWGEYADAFEGALGSAFAVLPRFMEVANPGASGLFANSAFYDALEAKAWCWFSVGNNAAYLDQDPSVMEAAEILALENPVNSEVFSLHLDYRSMREVEEWYVAGAGFTEAWTNFVCRVTGLAREEFSPESQSRVEGELWAFYDDNWCRWSTSFNPDSLPIAGALKPQYDVAGCVSSCMMHGDVVQIEDYEKGSSGASRTMLATADAKPLGAVRTEDGGESSVTAFHGFVAASSPGGRIFTEAQLVLVDAVPHSSGVCMEGDWYRHVKKHSPQNPAPGCHLCSLWSRWSDPSYRAKIREWLNRNGETCRPKGGDCDDCQRGGYPYAH